MVHQGFKGVFAKIKIKHKDGSSTVLDGFDNLITNAGLDFIGVDTAYAATRYCRVSSNAHDPLITDNSLIGQVGTASDLGSFVLSNSGGTPEWFQQMERVYTFPTGAVVGNISKLAVFSAASGGTMFSVALIKDSGGNPTTISLTAEDQLFITWVLRKYVSTTPMTGNVTIDFKGTPTVVAYEILPANLNQSGNDYYLSAYSSAGNVAKGAFYYETQTLGPVTGRPAGSALKADGVLSDYVSGNFYRDITYKALTSECNFPTGIGSMAYCCLYSFATITAYQISFNPKLPKDSDSTLELPFRLSWGRA